MSLERALTVWITERTLAGGLTIASPALRPDHGWPAATVETVAAALAAALQKGLWKGESVLDALATFPALTLDAAETLAVTLPEVRAVKGARPAIELAVPIVILRAVGGLLALAPGMALSWPGDTAEAAREGLRARILLHLLSREEPLDGAALVGLMTVTRATAEPVATNLEMPTANEVKEHAKHHARLLDTVLPPIAPAEAYGLEPELAALARAVGAGRSVVIVGPHGVGKTALVRELARSQERVLPPKRGEAPLHIRETTAPQLLMRLLDTGGGGWQDALVRLSAELAAARDWLYVGRLAELFEIGRYEGNTTSIGEYLAPAVQRGDVRLIAEATPEELARLDARYPGQLEGLVRLPFPEPTARLADIVARWAAARGPALGVAFDPDALREILRLQRRFAPYSGFPGRSLRFLEALGAALPPAERGHVTPVGRDAVIERFSAESGLPRPLIDPRTPLSYPEIRAHFDARIFGQPEAVTAVCDALATVTADVARAGKPLVSMLLVGPTGVGKTEMARALATFLFGDPRRMIRFDMSEYASPAAVLRLVEGQPAAGEGGDGQLTGAVRRQPFAVILLDELEKAHPAVLDLLLQVLGEGRLTDGRGVAADFCSTVVLMTSNVGAAEAKRGVGGFAAASPTGASPRLHAYHDAVRGWLRPELLNRIDRVLAFSPLTPEAVDRVLTRELLAFSERPGLRGRGFTVSPDARARLATAGFHPAWGARQLLRAVHDQLAAPTAAALDAWKDPAPADVRVGDTLRVELTRGTKRSYDTTIDALHARVQARRRTLAAVIDGCAFGEVEAADQADARRGKDRAEGRKGDRHGAAEPSVLARLRALAADTLALEMDLGVAALADTPAADAVAAARTRARVDALDRAARVACQDLYDRTAPAARSTIVAIYGQDAASLDQLVATYRSLAAAWRLQVEAAPLHLHDKGLLLVLPSEKPPERLGERVGVELLVTGPAAALVFATEAGVHRFATEREALVRVAVHAGTRQTWATPRPVDASEPGPAKGWATPRPAEPHRRHYFAPTPRRVYRGAVEDREEKWILEGMPQLVGYLSERFAARLVEALI